jgi:nucleoside-diphosphate-sugar epimerase
MAARPILRSVVIAASFRNQGFKAMRVFVTGASGWVGSAVVRDLLDAGHEVLGLVRSDAAAQALAATGAQVLRGDLQDLDSLRQGARQADGVIHTAFIHDFSKFAENCEIDRIAIQALGETLAGSERALVVSSGTGLLAPGGVATEDTDRPAGSPVPRVSEETALAFAPQGVRAMAVRLPPTVHGEGDHGFVPILIDLARQKGAAAYVGEGSNTWPAVHRFDAAPVYRLALEKGVAGARYHAVAEEGVPFRDIAAVIGRRLGVPVVSKTPAEAAEHFGWFSHFAAIDNRASSAKTREALGWSPTGIGLIEDLDQEYYFAG